MIKNFFALCFLFLSIQTFSQNIDQVRSIVNFSSESELVSYIEKTKSKGLSLLDVEQLALTQGAKPNEIELLRKLWNSNNNQLLKKKSTVNDSIPDSSFGNKKTEKTIKLNRFGSDFFNNKNISEAPQLFIATPLDYRLGPGDELTINLFGSSENTYSVQINRNGTVKFDRAAPIYLSGLSIDSAKKRLIKSLSKLYTGLLSSDEVNKVELDLSLSKSRSIVVNIVGQVIAPGTYTISGFSSVLNALYAAGGPNEVGSYRNIKLLRNGKVNKTIDLYDYFVKGLYPNVYLRDQDVILVDVYNKQVDVSSGFKTNALYELKENETVEDLLNFAGGFSSNSYKDKLFVNRINSYSRSIVEISNENFSKSVLFDGDIINAKTISSLIENSVSIVGAVYLPGTFDFKSVKNLRDLISSANGLNPNAINRGFIYRYEKGIEDEVIDLNLEDSQSLNVKLKDQDRVVILSRDDLIDFDTFSTVGLFNSPKTFTLKNGMTITDAIILSGGFKNNADKTNITLSRNKSSDNNLSLIENIKVSFDENYKTDNDVLLKKGDIIRARIIPFERSTKSFTISGEVNIPGSYTIDFEKFSISRALEKIEFTKNANIDQIYIERDGLRIPIKNINDNSFLISGNDKIVVPAVENVVKVIGSVQQPSIIDFNISKSFKMSITNSGGFTENADKKRAYVIYPNGLKKTVKSFLFLKTYPKLLPGSSIFVPAKSINRNKTSVAEIVGYSTSLVSIIALIKAF